MKKLSKKELSNISAGTIFKVHSKYQKKILFYVLIDDTAQLFSMPCRNIEEANHINAYLNKEASCCDTGDVIEISEDNTLLHSLIQEQ